ncbi:MAG: T9SS type A sorting domain-containing protein [Flavobacteriales bacterium]|nr:T9SS type A sorting domain-containing protein [Flavobacteriales bacterium]
MKRILLIAALVAAGQSRAQTITEYRYWINDNPATLTTASIGPNTVVELNAALDLPALTKDFNTVTIQFKDSNGDYSVPQTTWFSRNSGAVNGYEYWIDDAIASSAVGPIGPNNVVDLIADLPTGTTSGTHFFTIRFSSVNGSWSAPLTTEFSFFTGLEELPGVDRVLLFPNPAMQELWLRVDASTDQDLTVEMLDATGRVVKNATRMVVSRSGTLAINVDHLATGSYQVRLTGGRVPSPCRSFGSRKTLWFTNAPANTGVFGVQVGTDPYKIIA